MKHEGVQAQLRAGWDQLKGLDLGPEDAMGLTILARLKAVEAQAQAFRQAVADLALEPERVAERAARRAAGE